MTGTDGTSPVQEEGPGALLQSIPSALWEGNQRPGLPFRPEAKLTQETRHNELVSDQTARAAQWDRRELGWALDPPVSPWGSIRTSPVWAEPWVTMQKARSRPAWHPGWGCNGASQRVWVSFPLEQLLCHLSRRKWGVLGQPLGEEKWTRKVSLSRCSLGGPPWWSSG